MKVWLLLSSYWLGASALAVERSADELLLVVGDPGEAQYAAGFAEAAGIWQEMAEEAGIQTERVGPDSAEPEPKERVRTWIASRDINAAGTLWIAYLGHGTFSGGVAKLNLTGPDISARELQDWLAPFERPMVFVHGGSSSAPFIPALSADRRIIITATKSGEQQNYARFGEAFAKALQSPRSDLDLDGQVSLLEAFVSASTSVETGYLEAGRLSTEHALIDDDGDGRGLPAQSFRGLSLKDDSVTKQSRDGQLARRVALVPSADTLALNEARLEERDRLEAELEAVKRQKEALAPEAYYRELERIFRALAEVYAETSGDS